MMRQQSSMPVSKMSECCLRSDKAPSRQLRLMREPTWLLALRRTKSDCIAMLGRERFRHHGKESIMCLQNE